MSIHRASASHSRMTSTRREVSTRERALVMQKKNDYKLSLSLGQLSALRWHCLSTIIVTFKPAPNVH